MNHALRFSSLVAAVAFSLIILFPTATHAQSATTTDRMLTGYAWSSNIGWVSFNCDNAGTCLTDNEYKVKLLADGTLSGYAWSSNIGWIKFGGLSGFPGGSGTVAANASLSGGAFHGWARALSAGGGWDGWISLSGKTISSPVNFSNAPISATYAPGAQGTYGVTAGGNALTGYAWGSDVVGWLSFSTPNSSVRIEANDPSTDGTTLTSGTDCYGPDGYLIPDGTSRTYYDRAATCDSQARLCRQGVLGGDSNYQYATCSAGGADSGSVDATRQGPPVVSLSIGQDGGNFSHGPLLVSKGTKVSVKWDTTGGGTPDACIATAGIAGATISPLSGGSIPLGSVTTSTTYTLTCTNSGGSSSDSVRAIILNVNEF